MKCFFLLFFTLLGTQYGIHSITKEERLEQFAQQKLTIENNNTRDYSLEMEQFLDASDTIEVSFRLNYPEFAPDFKETDFYDVDNYKDALRLYGRNYHRSHNEEIMKTIDTSKMNDLYISCYSPFVTFMTTKDQLDNELKDTIDSLLENENVDSICIKKPAEHTPLLSDAMDFIGLTYYLENDRCSGTGIKIGILETGLVNQNHSNFSDTTITVNQRMFDSVTDHATQVATIIHTLAPASQLYSITIKNGPQEELDWLIRQGVDIVNCSYGDANPTGVYASDSAYMDYVIYSYKLTIIAAVGNEGDTNGYVSNPALGYNVVGVGACYSDHNVATDFTSYRTITGPDKPNILAPGDALALPGITGGVSGTSFSTPIISACVALLMQDYDDLKVHPEYVSSFLYTNTKIEPGSIVESGFNYYNGSGCINFDEFWWNHGLNWNTTISNNNSSWSQTINIGLRAHQKYKASLCWLAKATGSTSGTTKSNFDMRLYNANGALLTQSCSTNNNYELIFFDPPTAGTYTLICSVTGATIKEESLGFFYCIDA